VLSVVATLIATHVLRLVLGFPPEALALDARSLAAGRWASLITHLLVHASWTHVLLNSVFVLSFGAPVARYMGRGLLGGIKFIVFFLACGALAGLGFTALARYFMGPEPWALVGASGAASGLMGATARLIEGRGRPGSLFGRTVVGWTVVWILINAALGLSGLTPGSEGAPVAWQAHVLGYFAGLILIPLFGARSRAGDAMAT
jgi:membrane associated rhomboid family serine protease